MPELAPGLQPYHSEQHERGFEPVNSTEHGAMIRERVESTRFFGIPAYQHVERLGSDECEGLLDDLVVVQPKIDGANFTVGYGDDGHLVMASRNNAVYHGQQGILTGDKVFKAAIDYCLSSAALQGVYHGHPDWVLRGEWLVRHSINYAKEHINHFYVFDVQRRGTWEYVPYDEYVPVLRNQRVPFVPLLANGRFTVDELVGLVGGPDVFGAEQKEGIVVKRYAFRNRYGRATWGKLVSADFKEKNKLMFRPQRQDPPEIHFASLLTQADIVKAIHDTADRKGEPPNVRHMGEIIGRMWHDAIRENLWDFLKEHKLASDPQRTFSFGSARRLVETKTRETALAFYNGTLKEEGHDGLVQ